MKAIRTPSAKLLSIRRRIVLVFAGLALVILVCKLIPFIDEVFAEPYQFGQQARNIRLADEHAAKLLPTLRADTRFQNIDLHSYTGHGGSLAAIGTVATASDLHELQRLVIVSRPPVKVVFTDVLVSQPLPQ
jgi:hypothetical protein